jgi:hypothetical protein
MPQPLSFKRFTRRGIRKGIALMGGKEGKEEGEERLLRRRMTNLS